MKVDVKLLEIYPRNYPRVFHYYSRIQIFVHPNVRTFFLKV